MSHGFELFSATADELLVMSVSKSDLHEAVVGVGDVVCAADRCERRRTVAAAATFDIAG